MLHASTMTLWSPSTTFAARQTSRRRDGPLSGPQSLPFSRRRCRSPLLYRPSTSTVTSIGGGTPRRTQATATLTLAAIQNFSLMMTSLPVNRHVDRQWTFASHTGDSNLDFGCHTQTMLHTVNVELQLGVVTGRQSSRRPAPEVGPEPAQVAATLAGQTSTNSLVVLTERPQRREPESKIETKSRNGFFLTTTTTTTSNRRRCEAKRRCCETLGSELRCHSNFLRPRHTTTTPPSDPQLHQLVDKTKTGSALDAHSLSNGFNSHILFIFIIIHFFFFLLSM
jgi:hypothetical protein